jgi:ribosomal protein L44E
MNGRPLETIRLRRLPKPIRRQTLFNKWSYRRRRRWQRQYRIVLHSLAAAPRPFGRVESKNIRRAHVDCLCTDCALDRALQDHCVFGFAHRVLGFPHRTRQFD